MRKRTVQYVLYSTTYPSQGCRVMTFSPRHLVWGKIRWGLIDGVHISIKTSQTTRDSRSCHPGLKMLMNDRICYVFIELPPRLGHQVT
jgi:hypothetical protein